jgi:hypothetical protein
VILTGVPPPREPTALERVAELAGMEPDELRDYLRDAIKEAERAEMRRVLAEAQAEARLDETECAPVARQ